MGRDLPSVKDGRPGRPWRPLGDVHTPKLATAGLHGHRGIHTNDREDPDGAVLGDGVATAVKNVSGAQQFTTRRGLIQRVVRPVDHVVVTDACVAVSLGTGWDTVTSGNQREGKDYHS